MTLAGGRANLPQQIGGVLCFDFANTVEPRGGPSPYTPPTDGRVRIRHDALRNYAALIAWACAAGLLDVQQAQQYLDEARRRPDEAQTIFGRAIAMREALYRLFWTIAHGGEPAADDLALLRVEYARTSGGMVLRREGENYRCQWQPDGKVLDGLLWPIVQSAIALLTQGELDRVKVCPGANDPPPCAWLFYDESRNHTRQWCSMEDGCGGRAKMLRQNARRRSRAV